MTIVMKNLIMMKNKKKLNASPDASVYYPYENLESVEDNEGAVIFSGGEIEC